MSDNENPVTLESLQADVGLLRLQLGSHLNNNHNPHATDTVQTGARTLHRKLVEAQLQVIIQRARGLAISGLFMALLFGGLTVWSFITGDLPVIGVLVAAGLVFAAYFRLYMAEIRAYSVIGTIVDWDVPHEKPRNIAA